MALPDPTQVRGRSSVLDGQDEKAMKRRRDETRKQEDRIAAKGGGRRIPGSGNIRNGSANMLGDVDLGEFRVEAKRTDASSIRVSEEVITKAILEAKLNGQHMALALQVDGFKNSYLPKAFIVIEEDVFMEMLNRLKGEET